MADVCTSVHYKTLCNNILSVNYHTFYLMSATLLEQKPTAKHTVLLLRRLISTSNIYLKLNAFLIWYVMGKELHEFD